MATANRQAVVIPIALGPAAHYDRAAFPLSQLKGMDRLGKAEYLLDATLEEMKKIHSMGSNAKQVKEFMKTTKEQYDLLLADYEDLEQEQKTRNPLKLIARWRAVFIFLDETKKLYVSTRRKSDRLRRLINRNLMSVEGLDMQPVEDDVPPDANVTGIAVRLDRPMDEEMAVTIANAANTIACYADPFVMSHDFDHLSTNIIPSKPEAMKGAAALAPPTSETSAPRSSSQEYSPTTLRPSSSPASETSSPCCRSQDHSPFILRPTSPASSRMSEPYRHSQASLPTPRASSPSIQNLYYFDHSFVSPKSSVYGPSLVHGGSQNSGAVNHFTTLNSAPEAD